MAKKKILVLSVSAGWGHVRAGEALQCAAERFFPEDIDILHIDILSVMPLYMSFVYKYGYNFVVKYCPIVWELAYKYTDHNGEDNFITSIRKKVEMHSAKQLLKLIQEMNPDDIICTHFLPAQLLKEWYEQNRSRSGLWLVNTDYMVHRFWHVRGLTGYFSPTQENKEYMRVRGMSDERIEVTGIPISLKFSDPIPKQSSGVFFGVDTTKTTLLLIGGAARVSGLKNAVKKLLAIPADFQLIVLTGRSKKLYAAMQAVSAKSKGRLFPLPFTKSMEHLFNLSDLVLTKSGGLTVAECTAAGKPMVIFSPIPGQEESNAEYLIKQGAALRAYHMDEMAEQVALLLNRREILEEMAGHSRRIGRPYAARDVLKYVCSGGLPA